MEKICFRTYGCSNNFAESEMMQGIVKENFEIVNNAELADVVVMNVCTVKGDNQVISKIKKFREEYPYKGLILAGCLPIHLLKTIRKVDDKCAVLTTQNMDQINDVVEEVLNDNPIEIMCKNKVIKLGYPRVRRNKYIAIIPISNSCLGKCTYCSVRAVKGTYYSFPEKTILEEIKNAVKEGCKEIWITSQDNACYGIDLKTNLSHLLSKIVDLEGDFYVRVGMMNPDHILPYIDELIDVFRHKKIFKFLHIPVQSGSDRVLKDMGRNYSVEEFKEVVRRFREVIPKITVATDMIVGFPTEKEEDFEDSLSLLKAIRPGVLNVARFRKRPNTIAAKYRRLDKNIVKDRSIRMTTTFDWIGLDVNRQWRFWKGAAIVDEKGKEDTMLARNAYYKPIIIQGDYDIGSIVLVKITGINKHDLSAEIINNSNNDDDNRKQKNIYI